MATSRKPKNTSLPKRRLPSRQPHHVQKQSPPPNWPAGVPVPKPGPFRQNQRWTADEHEQLRLYYVVYGADYCARLLGRTKGAVQQKAMTLGLRRVPRWSTNEIEQLKSIYQSETSWKRRKAVRELDRGVHAIHKKVTALDVTSSPQPWSKQELQFLRSNYGKLPPKEIAKTLKRRYSQVIAMASRIGVSKKRKKATKREISLILRQIGKKSLRQLASELELPYAQVVRVASEHEKMRNRVQAHAPATTGLKKKSSHHRQEWTEEEEEILRKEYTQHGPRYTALLVGRTRKATSERARRMGLKFEKFKPWTKKEVKILNQMYPYSTYAQIAKRLGRSTHSIHQKLKRMRSMTSTND